MSQSLPPLEFTYSEPVINEELQEIDSASLENLPYGLDGTHYQWVDLDGEGLSGILTEQAGSWYYKRNASPANRRKRDGKEMIAAQFESIELVARQPSLSALARGGQQLIDLAGDGQLDLVQFDGPTPGFFERTDAEDWDSFTTFSSLPVLDWKNPNLKFIDLTGDGHADLLISGDEAFCWHTSLAEAGFGPAQRVKLTLDEEKGPRLVFADGTQSIFLADLSGDGLVDLLRITNGEVCYWPNLGYGRFGARVSMDDAPKFEAAELFDGRRVRLADIDGSGTADIIYLASEGVQFYFNQSGNRWGEKKTLSQSPQADNLSSVTALDLLGNGTACLVWSSPLPGAAPCAMRYIDLMGGQKPHMLTQVTNNLGARTEIRYAPSTQFYVADRQAGKPWATRVPFPVQVVEKVIFSDLWRGTTFTTTYSYHHGYFDGIEREFRGFGRVEQVDVESFGQFAAGNSTSPYITPDKMLYQPPVKTITWYHTGALLERERILTQFEGEYFPRGLEDLDADQRQVFMGFEENILPQPDLNMEDLSAEEWREALRACKGMMLRREVYELDIDALERPDNPKHHPVKLFSTAYHNCHIRRLLAKGANRHAVFLVAESEAITYHYELDLAQKDERPDPRIVHTLNLRFDEYANVLQSVAIVYPRLGQFKDDTLKQDEITLIRKVQQEPHLAYTETRYTDDVVPKLAGGVLTNRDTYRLRVPCEVLTYEVSGIKPQQRYFTLVELQGFQLSPVHQTPAPASMPVKDISYHEQPGRNIPEKRLVEHQRMLYFKDAPDDAASLKEPLALGRLGRMGLPFETYRLALTEQLLGAVYGAKLTPEVRSKLADAPVSGYLSAGPLAGRFPGIDTTGQYWIRSGIVGFAPDASEHFYLPERYTDPFGNVTKLEYDPLDLFVRSSADALGNTTLVTRFDFRVLAPREMRDINDNLSAVYFDVLGMPAAMAVMGKGSEGDDLTGFDENLVDPGSAELKAFFIGNDYNEAQARTWLGNATARFVYYFGETIEGGKIVWGKHPACACAVMREKHVSQLAPGEQPPLQASFEYSDGLGSVMVKKIQAEPEAPQGPLRWIASGKTIFNNKGKPVRQYEPYFSPSGHRFEDLIEVGVTSVIYYDAVGRIARTELPDGSFSRADFSPWHVASYDQNDTVMETSNEWFARKTAATATAEDKRAAQLSAEHAGTPALTLLDSLGREVVSIAHNRVSNDAGGLTDEKYLTFIMLDAEGKPLCIRDARKNIVMQYISPPIPNNQANDPVAGFVPCYDISGGLLFQHSMDAGDRWVLNDASGSSMIAWDNLGRIFRTEYDGLRRLLRQFVKGADPDAPDLEICLARTIYGEQHPEDKQRNLRGRAFLHLDQAGAVANDRHDFKGNLLRGSRRLAREYKQAVDWKPLEAALPTNPTDKLILASLENVMTLRLENESFKSSSSYDALNRPTQLVCPHSDRPLAKLNIIRPGYNEAGLLERVDVWLEQASEPTALLDRATATQHVISNIDYNAKGQRRLIAYSQNNGQVITRYTYDPQTFRLTHLVTTRPNHAEADKRTLQDLFYTYDAVGNITRIRDNAQDRVFHSNACVEPNAEYVYDALYRLTAASGREHRGNDGQPAWDDKARSGSIIPNDCQALRNYVETYRYDAVGNILQMLHHQGSVLDRPGQVIWRRRYQYALDSNRLLATRLPGDPANLPDYTDAAGYGAKYSYDLHGNVVAMPHLPVMEWDFKDQLRATQRQVVNNGGGAEKTFYVYDTGGERVRKITETQNGALKDERIYLGDFELYRKFTGNGQTVALERETLHVMDDKQRVALIETRTLDSQNTDRAPRQLVRFQLGNHLGSSALELDEQAQVVSYEEYHPFGSTAYHAARSQTDTPKRYKYTGKEKDEETGFTYHGARYYAGWLGRWVSCDPAGVAGDTNLYKYASNNPSNLVDLDGAFPKLPTLQEISAKAHRGIEQSKELAHRVSEQTKQAVAKGLEAVIPVEVGFVNANIKLVSEAAPKLLQASAAGLDPSTPIKAVAQQAIKPFVAPAKFIERKVAGDTTSDALNQAAEAGLKTLPFQQPAADLDMAIKAGQRGDVSAATEHGVVAGGHFAIEVLEIALALEGAAKTGPPGEGSIGADPWEGSVGPAKAFDKFERIVGEAEAKQIMETGKLQPKVWPSGRVDKSPKRISEPGMLESLINKRLKAYTHKVEIATKRGTAEWVEKDAKKIEGEPGRYELEQGTMLERFNEAIINIKVERLR
ncbi:MAG TPA: toxin TcdB middle/N-terminal domain-containing protein [Blastocatellia bacterium]|nr:toxin TcdB middle/N-terminal domain-containing protein [Blastocatellia bacterium]